MTFTVFGPPVAQGSLKGFVSRGATPRVILTNDNRKVMPWRQEIAARAVAEGISLIERGGVRLRVQFYLRRPPSRPKRERHADRRPDLDKLTRAVLDALTNIAFHDDSQVVELVAGKTYATAWVGARITVEAAS